MSLLMAAASVGPGFSDRGLTMTGSWDLAMYLIRMLVEEENFLLSRAFQGPGLASENDADSAPVGQAGGPIKEQGYLNTSLLSGLQFPSSLLRYTSHQQGNAKPAALVAS